MSPAPAPPPLPPQLPSSYATLPFTDIRISHHPASSPTPTPILILTLHRPQASNAFTEHMGRELVDAYTLFSADDRVRCIVYTGHGDRFFCAGADLNVGFEKHGPSASSHRDGGGKVVLAIHRCPKPTIGAINGSAVGVGLTMQLPMAIRVASRRAKFGAVFARRGIVADAAGSYFLPRLLGYGRATHLVTTGAVYAADSPLLLGLYSELLDEPAAVLPRALAIAEDVVANTSLVCGQLIRELIWRGPPSAEETHLLDSKLLYDCFGSRDNVEGMASFLEKRPVRFEGTLARDAPSAYPWWTPVDVSSPYGNAEEGSSSGGNGEEGAVGPELKLKTITVKSKI